MHDSNIGSTRPLGFVASAALVVLLAACGGGGGGDGVTSGGFTTQAAPVITTQPANQSINSGFTATFSVAATGAPTPAIQWQSSTDGVTWSAISGATGSSYTTPVETSVDNGISFEAVVSNAAGAVTSAPAVLTVN